ncbi:hypothetical protein P3X46_009415 [Hevea brasiliensis]|uniref:MADS-box domain-containing protein n=1 Tax=Hevea brasiliensis TaxID=3981 RepID=A0ABQ9MQV7_HEVBR|nr:hypothetical protein P3X46_009415 [Hevea brasiliensis]
MARKGTGRREIENKQHLGTIFTKQRNGLFKKADELCIHSGAYLAVINFSTHGRPYSFGKPSPDAVVDRFLIENSSNRRQC